MYYIWYVFVWTLVSSLWIHENQQFVSSVTLFKNLSISFEVNQTLTAIPFTIYFVNDFEITEYEDIIITLPRFTRRSRSNDYASNGYDIAMGSVRLAPSTRFIASWTEGEHLYSNTTPFRDSHLTIRSHFNQNIASGTSNALKIYPSNGIGALSGFPSSKVYFNYTGTARVSYPPFTISTNSTNSTQTVFKYDGIGAGCAHLNDCSGHGLCDYTREKCECDDGYGSDADIVDGHKLDGTCRQRVCPSGKMIRGVPSSATIAHNRYVECSGAGTCDRETGLCNCFAPFTGGACDRTSCPNDCSGHGQCASMRDMAKIYGQRDPLVFYEYGTANNLASSAWDFDVVYGCVCDSSWNVGYSEGETQLPEYFGADCSQRHCPSGDNPFTPYIEEDCQHKTQDGAPGQHRGKANNRCHVDCSDRGICDYKTGKCHCFEGSWGEACESIKNQGTREVDVFG